VEHPVTELITGLDLVELQLRIAEGEALPPEVLGARIGGHAIEARLYAEDVPAGYLPATGTLHDFAVPPGPGIRVDAGVAPGVVVGPYYDPMLAKVIAHGRTRADAARRLARALAGARIHGVTTNRDLLVSILREPDFLAGRTDTGYLTRHDPVSGEWSPGTTRHSRVHAVAAALAGQAASRAAATVLPGVPSGWRNVGGAGQRVRYAEGEQTLEVVYRFGRDGLRVTVDGEPVGESVRLLAASPDSVTLEVDGVRRAYAVHRVDGAGVGSGVWVYVDGPDGSSALREVPRFPDPTEAVAAGSLLAPMPGSVLRVLAEAGAEVTAGQPLIVLEAMKMEHTIAAPRTGTLTELPVRAGAQVDTGQVLAVVTEPEPEQH
jgi:acetyl/propionyl-CoA carboxylase alpha subunit